MIILQDIMKKRINSLRLPNYDYSLPGAYFITLCTQNRLHVFGHISDGKMILNEFGKIVEAVWINLPNHYPNMACGEFVVMPNHVHAVVILKPIGHMKGGFENPENAKAKEGRFQTCPNQEENHETAMGGFQSYPKKTSRAAKGEFQTRPNTKKTTHPNKIHGIPEIVRALKTFSARKINECRNSPGVSVWHRNYWERIVRNERALQAVNRYIQNNPLKWHLDGL